MFDVVEGVGLVLAEIAEGETLDTIKQATAAGFEVGSYNPCFIHYLFVGRKSDKQSYCTDDIFNFNTVIMVTLKLVFIK